MSIASEIKRINTNIANSYTAVENKNGTLPQVQNSANLASAIDSIQSSNIIGATAEGESLSLTNTKAMPYKDYVVKGKSEQETRSGKNLLNSLGLTTQTINGVTFTPVYENNSLQYININGTATDRADYKFVNYVTYNPNTYDLQKINTNSAISILLVTKGGSVVKSASVTKETFTITENTECLCWIRIYSGTTINNEKIYPQVKLSSITDDTYEPYGETPSPSNPSEIHSVADDVNLFDASKIQQSSIVVTDNGKTIELPIASSGNGNVNVNAFLKDLCPKLNVGDVVYLNFTRNINPNTNNFIYLYNSSASPSSVEWRNGTSKTIDQNLLDSYVILYGNKAQDGETQQIIITDFKIQKNKITPYSPYNQGTVTIKQRGKNENDGINYGFYIGAEATTYRISGGDNGICIPIRNQNYTISTKEVQARYRVACSNSLPSDTSQNCFNGVVKDGTNDNVTIDTSGYKYLLINCTNINDIQIEQGSTATPYEPYQGNDYTFQTEPLRSLPNGVKDTIEAEQHRKIEYLVFDGSDDEGWELWSGGTNTIGFKISNIANLKNIQSSSTENIVLSNYFKKKTNQDRLTGDDEEGFATAVGNLYFKINRTTVNSLAEWKIWLSTHPTEIIYELTEEVIEPLTQNQATTMLDIIKTGSYEGTTNIYTDEDIKPTIEIEYYKKG